jgi:hypothetical protein
LDRQGVLADATELRRDDQHLTEALPAIRAEHLAEPDTGATAGDLARTILAQLANASPGGRDLVTLAVGALVLLALRSDLHLEHDRGQGWKIKGRTRPLSDSAVGKILSQLLSTYLKP